MPEPTDLWSSLFTLPALIATLVAGLLVALFTFALNRLGTRIDQRTQARRENPSRSNIRAGRRYLTRLASRPRNLSGPPRWNLSFNSSLGAYELEQHGPDDVHDVRIDFFDTRKFKQSMLAPTVQVRLLAPGYPITMALGAPARVEHYGIALRWDDAFGTDQFERLRVRDAHQD
jgi:hypothetical protein